MLRGGWILVFFSLTGLFVPVSSLVETIAGTILMMVIFVVLIIRPETGVRKFEASRKDK